MLWRPYGPDADQAVLSLEQWRGLGRPGSLTERLRRMGAFRLQVLRECAAPASEDEAEAMGLPSRASCWLREVAMSVDGVPCVAARSMTPLAASWREWRGMRGLSERPLGSMLYDDPGVRRSPFDVTRLEAGQRWFADAAGDNTERRWGGLWARRSIFWRLAQPLLVAECFLPGFWSGVAREPG